MGVRKNFSYNLILTFAGYLFPLIVYPYISRILGPGNVGLCSYVDSIIDYFSLFSTMGISIYGVREIAKCESKDERDVVFTNLVVLHSITTLIAIVALVACTYSIDALTPYKEFLFIGVVKLIFVVFLTEWFFQGISDFKYITTRSILIRSIYVVCVLVFVRQKGDAVVYYALTALVTVTNSVVNWQYGKKFHSLKFNSLSLRKYISPVLSFGFYKIITSMYTTFNVLFLGSVCSNVQVGYFTTSTKLYNVIMAFLGAFTTVMIPKVSYMIGKRQIEELRRITTDVLTLIIICAIPAIAVCEANSNCLIYLLSGSGYDGAVVPFRICIILVLIIGFEQVIIQQYLLASGSQKAVLTVGIVGAIVGISTNVLFTPDLQAVGSSIAWGLSECCVLLVGIYYLKRVLSISLEYKRLLKRLVVNSIYVVVFAVNLLNISDYARLAISVSLAIALFIGINLHIDRNKYIYELYSRVAHLHK